MTQQDALHAALREACESAAMKAEGPIYNMDGNAAVGRLADIIERHLTPVVEALVAGAYKACAEGVSEATKAIGDETEDCRQVGKLLQSFIEGFAALTPDSAARALREHDNALIEKCVKLCDARIKTANDEAAVAFALAAEEIRRLGSNIDALQSYSHYASYANHCAIRKVIPLTFHSWKRHNMPKAPDDLSHPAQ